MIQKTTNYDLFKTVRGNRTINTNHLAKLTLSVAKKNLLEYAPIMVNESMEVIDGQHRLEVARQQNLPIYYTIVPRAGLGEVIELNTTLRNWKLVDFVDSMIVQGNPDMKYLREFCDDYSISITQGLKLHVGAVGGSHVSGRSMLERTHFSNNQKENAHKAADLYFVLRQFVKRVGALPYAVVIACRRIAEEGLDKKVADAIQKRGKMIALSLDQEEMYHILKSYLS